MEYPTFNEHFLKEIDKFIPGVILTKEFIEMLKSRREFVFKIDDILEPKSPGMKKKQLFTKLTESQNEVDILVSILNESKQEHMADKLRAYFFESSPVPKFVTNVKIESADFIRYDPIKMHKMNSKPRGLAYIFLLKDKSMNEELLWTNIFEQLYFEVKVSWFISCDQINSILDQIVECKEYTGDALFVLIIGDSFGDIIIGGDKNDNLNIEHVLQKFSKEDCPLLNIPKIFMFNSCRIAVPGRKRKKDDLFPHISDGYTNTYVIYSSTKGAPINYTYDNGVSYFGKMLSKTICNYSKSYNLEELFNKTKQTLELDEKYNNVVSKFYKFSSKELYFNPGLP